MHRGAVQPVFPLKDIQMQREVVQSPVFTPQKSWDMARVHQSHKYFYDRRGKGHYGALLVPTIDSVFAAFQI